MAVDAKYVVFTYRSNRDEEAIRFASLDSALGEVRRLLPVSAKRQHSPLEWGGFTAFDADGLAQITMEPARWQEPFKSGFANPEKVTTIIIQREDVAAGVESGRCAEGNRPVKIVDAA